MKKRYFAFALCAMLLCCALLSGCGMPGSRQDQIEVLPSATEAAPEETAQQTAQPSPANDAERESMLAAYRAALTTLLNDHTLPDGTDCGTDGIPFPEGNKFAIYDVDADGQDELITIYTTTYMAGMTQCVFGYDAQSGKLKTQLCEYPLLTFYDNGVIEAGWSHNQGLAGEFWPYTVYTYDAGSDAYIYAGTVDAWDSSFAQEDYDGNPFPTDVDTSGKGIVYYVTDDGAANEQPAPVDSSAFEQWRDAYRGGASTLDISFAVLSEENIAGIA